MRCGSTQGVVAAHYFGLRRHRYGGGMGIKGNDLIVAHLCQQCHVFLDTLSKDKALRWEHSEEFLHLCALTIIRLHGQGVLIVKGERR